MKVVPGFFSFNNIKGCAGHYWSMPKFATCEQWRSVGGWAAGAVATGTTSRGPKSAEPQVQGVTAAGLQELNPSSAIIGWIGRAPGRHWLQISGGFSCSAAPVESVQRGCCRASLDLIVCHRLIPTSS